MCHSAEWLLTLAENMGIRNDPPIYRSTSVNIEGKLCVNPTNSPMAQVQQYITNNATVVPGNKTRMGLQRYGRVPQLRSPRQAEVVAGQNVFSPAVLLHATSSIITKQRGGETVGCETITEAIPDAIAIAAVVAVPASAA